MLAYALASKPCSEATDIGYYMALFRNPTDMHQQKVKMSLTQMKSNITNH